MTVKTQDTEFRNSEADDADGDPASEVDALETSVRGGPLSCETKFHAALLDALNAELSPRFARPAAGRMEQRQPAAQGERQFAELVKDQEVPAGDRTRQPSLAVRLGFRVDSVHEIDVCRSKIRPTDEIARLMPDWIKKRLLQCRRK